MAADLQGEEGSQDLSSDKDFQERGSVYACPKIAVLYMHVLRGASEVWGWCCFWKKNQNPTRDCIEAPTVHSVPPLPRGR